MRLYLAQHGEACSSEVDPARPLTPRGMQDVDRMAQCLSDAGVRIERVIHSGKLRAQQSAERLASRIAPGVELEESGLINPNDNPQAFDWQSGAWDRDCLVVGHLPFLSRLVSHLVVGNPDPPCVEFTPGSVACLIRDADERWVIGWMMRPELLTG